VLCASPHVSVTLFLFGYTGRPVEDLDKIPLSARRGEMEPGASRAVENSAPEMKLFGTVKYHIRDWSIIIVCIILDVILNVIHPYKRFVGQYNFLYSQTLRYPLKGETVPTWALVVRVLSLSYKYICDIRIHSL
jgi:hypothetical protein